jgi:hypothetical protein
LSLARAWVSVPPTKKAQAKTTIRKSLLVGLCLEFMTQVSAETNFSSTTFIVTAVIATPCP